MTLDQETIAPPQSSPALGGAPRIGPVHRVHIVWNEASGATGEAQLAEIRQRFAHAGVEVEAFGSAASGGPLAAARRAVVVGGGGADAIIAAGGDGTVNAVASAVAGSGVAMGVLPLGTLNHFARDLRLPPDPARAVAVIAAGKIATVDAAEVNGRLFVNNSSIGIYPRVVRHRNRLRGRAVLTRGVAMLYAAVAAFRRYAQLDVALGVGGETVHRLTPFVFVGNNRYALHLMAFGARHCLDRGQLCVFVAQRPGRFGLLRLLVLALFRRLKQARDFDSFVLPEVTVDTPKRQLAVAIDGEVVHLTPPLRYRTRAAALKVIVP